MFQKLEAVEKRFEELTQKISDPNVIANQNEWREFMKEHAELEPIVEKYREYKKIQKEFEDAKEITPLIIYCEDIGCGSSEPPLPKACS